MNGWCGVQAGGECVRDTPRCVVFAGLKIEASAGPGHLGFAKVFGSLDPTEGMSNSF